MAITLAVALRSAPHAVRVAPHQIHAPTKPAAPTPEDLRRLAEAAERRAKRRQKRIAERLKLEMDEVRKVHNVG